MITNPSNFRDLHDCYDFIEAGHLYRSALPRNLTKQDWDKLYNLGIRYIIDFRSEFERKASMPNFGIRVHGMSTFQRDIPYQRTRVDLPTNCDRGL